MRIVLLTTGHPPEDDRIFHKIARTLQSWGHEVYIIASTQDKQEKIHGVSFICFNGEYLSKPQIYTKFFRIISGINPDKIIIAELMPVFPAFLHKLLSDRTPEIYYDVTEFYPDMIYNRYRGIKRVLIQPLLYLLFHFGLQLTDGYFGCEKAKMWKVFCSAPQKNYIYLPYFPVLAQFPYLKKEITEGRINICYSGLFTRDRGFFRVIETVILLKNLRPKLEVILTLIGRFTNEQEEAEFDTIKSTLSSNIDFRILGWKKYDELAECFRDADICVDLRDDNYVYSNSLPIKFFDYLAMGKPVIYGLNNAIQSLTDLTLYGQWTEISDLRKTVECCTFYLDNPGIYFRHSLNGRLAAESKFNWEKASEALSEILK